MGESLARGLVESIDKELKDFMLRLASKLGWRVDRVLDAYQLAKLVTILDVKDDGKSIIGLRVRLPSESRHGNFHYVTIGPYGAKCTCEASVIKRGICKHIVAALITWGILNFIKYGKFISLDDIPWLEEKSQESSS